MDSQKILYHILLYPSNTKIEEPFKKSLLLGLPELFLSAHFSPFLIKNNYFGTERAKISKTKKIKNLLLLWLPELFYQTDVQFFAS
jgi:hypothetical protein